MSVSKIEKPALSVPTLLLALTPLTAKDVGSSEVQIAILTERIRYLTEHFTKNKKDKHTWKIKKITKLL